MNTDVKNNKKLYIIAAGLASRMDGYPKHLCVIDNKGTTNIENTLYLACVYYNEIVVVLNKMLASEYAVKTIAIAEKYNAKVKFIESGKGDGHAVYEAIKDEKEYTEVTCIWGDTYFSDSHIFQLRIHADLLTVVCSNEISPYCYINISNDFLFSDYIIDSYKKISSMCFKNDYPIKDNEKYLHDQSTFVVNVNKFKKYFSQYIDYCDYMTKTFIKSKDIEYSIIKFTNWLVQMLSKHDLIKAFILPEPIAIYPYTISFNTKEELQKIINLNNQINHEKTSSN